MVMIQDPMSPEGIAYRIAQLENELKVESRDAYRASLSVASDHQRQVINVFIDSGATSLVSSNADTFTGIDSSNRFPLQVLGNKTLMLDGVGDVSLCLICLDKENSFGCLTIPDCYYLKSTKYTLLSTCQLEDLGFAVRFVERDIVNLSTGESICSFERRGRVLVLSMYQDQLTSAVPII